MRVEVQSSGDREIDDPAHHLAAGILAKDVKLADSAIRAPRKFALDERQDFSVAKPGPAIGVAAVGADEGDYLHLPGAGGEKRPCPLIGDAAGQDRPDPVAAQDLECGRYRIRRGRLGVVVQMGVEDGWRLGAERGRRPQCQHSAPFWIAPDAAHLAPLLGDRV